jgi:hypothetical protein
MAAAFFFLPEFGVLGKRDFSSFSGSLASLLLTFGIIPVSAVR